MIRGIFTFTFNTQLVWNIPHHWCFTWKELLRTALPLNFGWIEAIITLCMNVDPHYKSMMDIFNISNLLCWQLSPPSLVLIYFLKPAHLSIIQFCHIWKVVVVQQAFTQQPQLFWVLRCSLFDLLCSKQLQKNKFLIRNHNHTSAYKSGIHGLKTPAPLSKSFGSSINSQALTKNLQRQ